MIQRTVLLIVLIAAATAAAAAPEATVRERVQQALAKTLDLQSGAIAPEDPRALGGQMMYRESHNWTEGRDAIKGTIFPTLNQIKEYMAFRPAAILYLPLRDRQMSYLRDGATVPDSMPLQFTLADAPGLRKLLQDPDPALRSLAVESLAALEQVEDIPAIAALIDDPAAGAPSLEFNQQMSAMFVFHATTTDDAKSAVVVRSWRTKTVGDYASRAIYFLTGVHEVLDGYRHMDAKGFAAWWASHSDARNCLWYWQRRIDVELRKLGFRPMVFSMEAEKRGDPERKAIIDRLCRELRKQPPELEAKVLLLALWGEEYGGEGSYSPPINLRVKPERLLELLEKKNLWSDVDWEQFYDRLVERISLDTHVLRRADVPHLRAVLANIKDAGWRAEPALAICISRLLPPARPSNLEDLSTRDGTLRTGLRTISDDMSKGMLAAELVRVGLPVNWPFLREQFFAGPEAEVHLLDGRDYVIHALGQAPLTKAKREALVDLVTDERFRVYWTQTGGFGDDLYRRRAIGSINAHAGRTLVDYTEEQDLTRSGKSETAFANILAKAKSLLRSSK